MREKWAKRITYLTGILVILLAAYFAKIQNSEVISQLKESQTQSHDLQSYIPDNIKPEQFETERFKHGLKTYNQQGCALCHAIQGNGNPRYPLDDVAAKLSAKELRSWILGDIEIQGKLSERSFNFKQKHRELTDYELESLVYYLQNLKHL